jgi:hypothetical protein
MSSTVTLRIERLSETEAILTASGTFASPTPSLRGGRVYLVAPFTQITDGLATLSDNTLATQRPSRLTSADTFAGTFRVNGQPVSVLRLVFDVNHAEGDTISGKVRLALPPGSSLIAAGSQGEIWYGSSNNADLLTRTGTWEMVNPAVVQAAAYTYSGSGLVESRNVTFGFRFQPAASIAVTAVGHFDYNHDGLVATHRIGLWRLDGTLLAEVNAPAGTAGTLLDNYRYTNLSAPVALSADQTYVIGIQTQKSEHYPWQIALNYSPQIIPRSGTLQGTGTGLIFPTASAGSHQRAPVNFLFNAAA